MERSLCMSDPWSGWAPGSRVRRPDLSSQGCRLNKNTKPEYCTDWTPGHQSAIPSFPVTLLALKFVPNFNLNIDGAFLRVPSARTVKEKKKHLEKVENVTNVMFSYLSLLLFHVPCTTQWKLKTCV